MSNSYANIHLLLHDIYLNSVSKLAPYAKHLDWSARSMLDKAKITSNVKRAKILRSLVDKHIANNLENDDDREELFLIHQVLSECFEVVVDDLMLLSAFEMYAKGQLLRKGYLVHEISKPSLLNKKQRTSPVHVRTIRAHAKRGEKIKFSEKTIGIGQLVEQGYIGKYPLTEDELVGLSEVRKRRNLVHFQMGMSWRISKELLAFTEYLDSKIPLHETSENN